MQMHKYAAWVWGCLVLLGLVYAVLKEREEAGCHRGVSVSRQCADENSVYVRGTKMQPQDSPDDLALRMRSILSYHEKGGVWKRCYIIATGLVFIVYIVGSCCPDKKGNIAYWFTLHMMFLAILYFFFNYINYHHFRLLKRIGTDILDTIIARCAMQTQRTRMM